MDDAKEDWPEVRSQQAGDRRPPRSVKWLLRFLGLVMVAFVVGGLLLPGSQEVSRSRLIHGDPSKIYDLLVEPGKWTEWAPWFTDAPFTETKALPPERGVGALLAWQNNGQRGKLKITAAQPHTGLHVLVELPDDGEVRSFISLKPQGAGTVVTWTAGSEFGRNYGRRYHGWMMSTRVAADLERALEALEMAVQR